MKSGPASIVLRWYEAVNTAEEARLSEMSHAGFVAHIAGQDFSAEFLTQMRRGYRAAFPDFAVQARVLHGSDEFVTASTVTTGTQQGTFMGHPSRGRTIRATGLDVFRIAEGVVIEMWSEFDTEGMLRQLGLRDG